MCICPSWSHWSLGLNYMNILFMKVLLTAQWLIPISSSPRPQCNNISHNTEQDGVPRLFKQFLQSNIKIKPYRHQIFKLQTSTKTSTTESDPPACMNREGSYEHIMALLNDFLLTWVAENFIIWVSLYDLKYLKNDNLKKLFAKIIQTKWRLVTPCHDPSQELYSFKKTVKISL